MLGPTACLFWERVGKVYVQNSHNNSEPVPSNKKIAMSTKGISIMILLCGVNDLFIPLLRKNQVNVITEP